MQITTASLKSILYLQILAFFLSAKCVDSKSQSQSLTSKSRSIAEVPPHLISNCCNCEAESTQPTGVSCTAVASEIKSPSTTTCVYTSTYTSEDLDQDSTVTETVTESLLLPAKCVHTATATAKVPSPETVEAASSVTSTFAHTQTLAKARPTVPPKPLKLLHKKNHVHVASLVLPYPFTPPKECTFLFLRLLRVNLYFFCRAILKVPVDIDCIKLSNCYLNSDHEGNNHEHTIHIDAEFRVLPNLQSAAFSAALGDDAVSGSSSASAIADTAAALIHHRIEVALERIEPAKLHSNNDFSTGVVREAKLPDLTFANFNCMPMNRQDLANARQIASVFRKIVAFVAIVASVAFVFFVSLQYTQLRRSSNDYWLRSI